MIIYNVTSRLDWSIHEDWLEWMKIEHIPQVLATGCFIHHQLVRLLQTDDTEGPTFAIQYFCNSMDICNVYFEIHAPKLRNDVIQKWGDRFVSFRSLMEIIS